MYVPRVVTWVLNDKVYFAHAHSCSCLCTGNYCVRHSSTSKLSLEKDVQEERQVRGSWQGLRQHCHSSGSVEVWRVSAHWRPVCCSSSTSTTISELAWISRLLSIRTMRTMDYITHNCSLRWTLVARTLEGRGERAEGEHSTYACYDLLSNILYLILRHQIDYVNQTKYLP